MPAVVTAGLAGHLVALGTSRLDGAVLGLATWALAGLVLRVLPAFPGLSGGAQGLVRPVPARLVSPALGTELVLTPAVHVVVAGLLATALGVPVAARRRAVLTAAGVLGGLSGAGTLVLLGVVAPADVGPVLSLQLFVAVLVGGTARWWGPVLGVALLSVLPPVADAVAGDLGADPQRLRGLLTAVLLAVVLALRRVLARRPAPSAVARPAGRGNGPAAGRADAVAAAAAAGQKRLGGVRRRAGARRRRDRPARRAGSRPRGPERLGHVDAAAGAVGRAAGRRRRGRRGAPGRGWPAGRRRRRSGSCRCLA